MKKFSILGITLSLFFPSIPLISASLVAGTITSVVFVVNAPSASAGTLSCSTNSWGTTNCSGTGGSTSCSTNSWGSTNCSGTGGSTSCSTNSWGTTNCSGTGGSTSCSTNSWGTTNCSGTKGSYSCNTNSWGTTNCSGSGLDVIPIPTPTPKPTNKIGSGSTVPNPNNAVPTPNTSPPTQSLTTTKCSKIDSAALVQEVLNMRSLIVEMTNNFPSYKTEIGALSEELDTILTEAGKDICVTTSENINSKLDLALVSSLASLVVKLKSSITNATNLTLIIQKTPTKLIKISCIKNGNTKVLSGSNPKCPTGYKKTS